MRKATYAFQGRSSSRPAPPGPGQGSTTSRLNIGKHGSQAAKTAPATRDTICQRCEGRGHYTADCTKPRVYKARPSRTQQLLNPKKQQKLLTEGEGFDGPKREGVAAGILEENARQRDKANRSRSSSGSSSSGSSGSSSSGSESESDSGSSSGSRSRSASPRQPRKRQASDSPRRDASRSPPVQRRRVDDD